MPSSRQQRQEKTVAQMHAIWLLLAQRQQQPEQTLDRTVTLQEVNTIAIAELRAMLRDRYSNGQAGDRP